jgi:hypothetical protein
VITRNNAPSNRGKTGILYSVASMKKYSKVVALNIGITLMIFGGAEIFSRGLSAGFSEPHIFSNFKTRNEEMKEVFLNAENEFDRKVFCDIAHKTDLGNQLVARLLKQSSAFKNLPRGEIWALGGSTTEEIDCPSSTPWTDYLQKFVTQKVRNYGKSAKNSDYSIEVLKKNISEGRIPGTVLWSNWLNEVLVHGDANDPNFSELQKKYVLKANPPFSRSKYWGHRLSKTLYENSYFCRGIVNLSNRISSSKERITSEDISNFQVHMDMINQNGEMEVPFFPPAFGGNVDEYIRYTLDNIRLNLEKLNQLSRQHGFEVILLYEPVAQEHYKKFYPTWNHFFENIWYPQNHKAFLEGAEQYGWKSVDMQGEFRKKRNELGSRSFSKIDDLF